MLIIEFARITLKLFALVDITMEEHVSPIIDLENVRTDGVGIGGLTLVKRTLQLVIVDDKESISTERDV